MNLLRAMCSACLLCAMIPAAAQTPAPNQPLAPGQLLESVPCASDPTQTYALYLPSTYNPARKWPIIYAFDPAARGNLPVKLYKDIAEMYGFILAGSNNSRNFSMAAASNGANALWQDTHARLSLDPRRIYTTGFSGGARVAGLVALRCPQCQIAGVIAHGAGYPSTDKPAATNPLLYFLAVGDHDFNWPEVISTRREREESALPARVRVFSGSHQWAPPAVMQDAVEWIQLKSMQAGTRPADAAFIEQFFNRTKAEAEDAHRRSDAIAEFSACNSLVYDFRGLKDITEYEARLAALKKSRALKAALRIEQDQIFTQASRQHNVAPQLNALADADDPAMLHATILQQMMGLKDQAAHSKDPENRLVSVRAFNSLWAQGIEAGQAQFESRHFDKAELYFQLMGDVSDDPWPVLLLAETRTAMGNKKQAIKDLREAVKRGVNDPEAFRKDEKLKALVPDPEFQKILESMSKK